MVDPISPDSSPAHVMAQIACDLEEVKPQSRLTPEQWYSIFQLILRLLEIFGVLQTDED